MSAETDTAGTDCGRLTSDVVTVHLVRHGETTTYDHDAGLTGLGRQQATTYATALAETIPATAPIEILHSTTARTAETAHLIHEFLSASRENLAPPVPDDAFRNMQVFVGGLGLEPTCARTLLDECTGHEGWAAEARRFWSRHESAADPVGFWMTTPLLWHESPADVVWRLLHRCEDRARELPPGTHLVAVSHEGCIRAIVGWARDGDPGHLHNLAELRLSYNRVSGAVLLHHLGRTTTLPPTR